MGPGVASATFAAATPKAASLATGARSAGQTWRWRTERVPSPSIRGASTAGQVGTVRAEACTKPRPPRRRSARLPARWPEPRPGPAPRAAGSRGAPAAPGSRRSSARPRDPPGRGRPARGGHASSRPALQRRRRASPARGTAVRPVGEAGEHVAAQTVGARRIRGEGSSEGRHRDLPRRVELDEHREEAQHGETHEDGGPMEARRAGTGASGPRRPRQLGQRASVPALGARAPPAADASLTRLPGAGRRPASSASTATSTRSPPRRSGVPSRSAPTPTASTSARTGGSQAEHPRAVGRGKTVRDPWRLRCPCSPASQEPCATAPPSRTGSCPTPSSASAASSGARPCRRRASRATATGRWSRSSAPCWVTGCRRWRRPARRPSACGVHSADPQPSPIGLGPVAPRWATLGPMADDGFDPHHPGPPPARNPHLRCDREPPPPAAITTPEAARASPTSRAPTAPGSRQPEEGRAMVERTEIPGTMGTRDARRTEGAPRARAP
jgi:hypothetical protein